MDFLLFHKYFIKFSRFFATGSTGWHPVQPLHRVSRCRTLIFGNYFDHISLFRTRNCIPLFFMDSSLFQKHSIKFSRFFATGSTSWHPIQSVQPVHWVSQCRTLIFGNYFDHISLFRTRNCVPLFFHGFLTLPETFYQIFKIFCNWFDRLTSGSAGSSSQLV